MKKLDKSKVEYATLTIVPSLKELYTDNIEYRSEASIDNELEFIKAHWQDKINKHQPPIIRTMEDLKLLDKGKNS